MKAAALILFLIFSENSEPPTGVWMYQEDFSRIEISEHNGILSGTLISTRNPNYSPGTQILRGFNYLDGKWQGKLYLSPKKGG